MTRTTTSCLAAVATAVTLAAATSALAAGSAPYTRAQVRAVMRELRGLEIARFNEALDLLEAGRYAEARAVLKDQMRRALIPYEVSRVQMLLFKIAVMENQYDEAREHLRLAIRTHVLDEAELFSAQFQLAQLMLFEQRWEEAAAALEAWLASGAPPDAQAYYYLALAYFQLDRHDLALAPAQQAVDLADTPVESHLQLLLSLRTEREEYALAVPLLTRLAALEPGKKAYWLQLALLNAELERYDEARLALQLAYHAGLLTEPQEYRMLADLLLRANIPSRAARILTQALEGAELPGEAQDWETLGGAWVAAHELEQALGPLERAAALSQDGDAYVRLASVEVQLEHWASAVEALRHGLDKGGVEEAGAAELLMGVALFNQGKLREARAQFSRAARHPKNRKDAEGWLQYLEGGSRS